MDSSEELEELSNDRKAKSRRHNIISGVPPSQVGRGCPPGTPPYPSLKKVPGQGCIPQVRSSHPATSTKHFKNTFFQTFLEPPPPGAGQKKGWGERGKKAMINKQEQHQPWLCQTVMPENSTIQETAIPECWPDCRVGKRGGGYSRTINSDSTCASVYCIS